MLTLLIKLWVALRVLTPTESLHRAQFAAFTRQDTDPDGICINSAAEQCLTYIWTNLIFSLEGISRPRVRWKTVILFKFGCRERRNVWGQLWALSFLQAAVWSIPTFLCPSAKFWRGSVVKGIPLGYYDFWCILFCKEGAFCLGDREMKQISFRKAVPVPNFCIVKVEN